MFLKEDNLELGELKLVKLVLSMLELIRFKLFDGESKKFLELLLWLIEEWEQFEWEEDKNFNNKFHIIFLIFEI